MSSLKPELVIDGLMFPEGPRWWDDQLWFSDVYGQNVCRMNADGTGLTTVAEFEHWPSGLGQLPDGTRIVVEMRSQKLWKLPRDGEEAALFADLSGIAVHEVNDLVTDPTGRSYSGCFGYDALGGARPAPGSVILTELDGSSRIVAGDVMFPNGMAVSEDATTLTVAQTQGGEVTAFDIDEDGSLSNRRPFAELPDATPDGICLDADGGMWIGSVFTSEFLRVDRSGRVTHQIPVPGRMALAPMLGGADRRTLFLLSTDNENARLRKTEMQGRIEAVTVDIPAAGLP